MKIDSKIQKFQVKITGSIGANNHDERYLTFKGGVFNAPVSREEADQLVGQWVDIGDFGGGVFGGENDL